MKTVADATALYVTTIGYHPNEQCMQAGGNRVCNRRQRLGFVLLTGCTADVGVAVTKQRCRLDDHEITVSHHPIVDSASRCDGPTMAAEHDR
jgi:hypothetical protein